MALLDQLLAKFYPIGLTVTESELDNMQFFMEQSASTYCNYKQAAGDFVKCDREGTIGGKCPLIQDDGVQILWIYV